MGSIYSMLSITGTKILILAFCLAKALIAVEDVKEVEDVIKDAEKLLSSLVSGADDELIDCNKEVIAVDDGENNTNKKSNTIENNKSAKLVRKEVKTFYYTTARTISLKKVQTTISKIKTEEDRSITSPTSTNANKVSTPEKTNPPKSSSKPEDSLPPIDSIVDLVSLRNADEESLPNLRELANARNLLGTALKDANPENL